MNPHSLLLILLVGASLSGMQLCAADLNVPTAAPVEPTADKRAIVTTPEYAGTEVYHTLYLPPDWTSDWQAQNKSWPVIVEYTGNKAPSLGSTGLVEDAALGFGITGGRFIWIVLPYVSSDHQRNELTWWGDIEATVAYAKTNVPRICEMYGGDPQSVLLSGFSRGAIAVNFIGLHDDEIAKLWCGFVTHDHYDGVKEWKNTTWGSPLDRYREAAASRLRRLQSKPVLICQNQSTEAIQSYLQPYRSLAAFTILTIQTEEILGAYPNDFAIHAHNDRWLLRDSPARTQVWQWVDRVISR